MYLSIIKGYSRNDFIYLLHVPAMNLGGKTRLTAEKEQITDASIPRQEREKPGYDDKQDDAPLLDLTTRERWRRHESNPFLHMAAPTCL
jgi:hypothetical protein